MFSDMNMEFMSLSFGGMILGTSLFNYIKFSFYLKGKLWCDHRVA